MLHRNADARLRVDLDTLQEENIQLRERLDDLTGRSLATRARLLLGATKKESIILGLLVRCGFAAYSTLYDAIWDNLDEDQPERPDLRTHSHVKRLRRRLRPHGIDLRAVYGEGYAMDERDRARCRQLLA